MTEKFDKNGKLVEKITVTDATSYYDNYCWHHHTSPYWSYTIGSASSTLNPAISGTTTTNAAPFSTKIINSDGGWTTTTINTLLTDN